MNPAIKRKRNRWNGQRHLIGRHYFQVRARELDPALDQVFAIAFAPIGRSAGFKDGLLRKVGTTLMIVLSYEQGSGLTGFSMPLRGFRGRACPDGTIEYGGPDGCAFSYDLVLRPGPRANGQVINSRRNPQLIELALRMDQVCKKLGGNGHRLPTIPRLPKVWLGFAPDEPPAFEDSTALRRLAAAELDVSVDSLGRNGEELLERYLRDLWERQLVPPTATSNPTGLLLADSELCTQARRALEIHEDFSQLVGLRVWNPVRDIELLRLPNPAREILRQFEIDTSQDFSQPLADSVLQRLEHAMREAIGLIHKRFTPEEIFDGLTSPDQPLVGISACLPQLRRKLQPSISAGCTDDDLLRAARNPHEPLVASRACRVQVLRGTDGIAARQLRFSPCDLRRRIVVDLNDVAMDLPVAIV